MAKLSLKRIQRQIETLKAKAEKLRKRYKKPTIRQIALLMRTHDISISELRSAPLATGGKRKAGALKGCKIKAMFTNPKTGETWSGRGRPARWIVAAEKAGQKRAEFLIKKA